ncbi:solute-binding protein [Candidatus Phycosocius bacilliformis]|uniref:Solute-binding protein n=1 Tax=Candidatus Phycosocius bacilliformis TaxID=1445552 RepID=A0A2P2ECG9_9PROT|nr:TRAP transporter substrate-binding protein [Candidatus Phycosocius bacilliformis]GBF58768.1 solute-binding protein [Candidatus Phycosocius bacilliformis]
MRLNRRFVMALAGGGLLAACEPADHGGVLTACDVHRDGYPTVEAVKWLGQRLSEQTQGRLTIRNYPSGQLGVEDDTIALAQSGVIDMCRVNAASLNNAFPLTQVVCMPFGIEDDAHLHRVLDGAIGQEILNSFANRGLIGLAAYDAGGRCFYNTHRPIVQPSDLKGLKIRVPQSDVFIDAVAAMGANPTPLGVGAVYSALQSRLIDGAENNWPTFDSSRHVEVAHYWSNTRHSYSPEFLLMSAKSFARLSTTDQATLRELAKASVQVMRQNWARFEAESRDRALKAGTKMVDVDRATFKQACEPVNRARLTHPDVARLFAAVRAMV